MDIALSYQGSTSVPDRPTCTCHPPCRRIQSNKACHSGLAYRPRMANQSAQEQSAKKGWILHSPSRAPRWYRTDRPALATHPAVETSQTKLVTATSHIGQECTTSRRKSSLGRSGGYCTTVHGTRRYLTDRLTLATHPAVESSQTKLVTATWHIGREWSTSRRHSSLQRTGGYCTPLPWVHVVQDKPTCTFHSPCRRNQSNKACHSGLAYRPRMANQSAQEQSAKKGWILHSPSRAPRWYRTDRPALATHPAVETSQTKLVTEAWHIGRECTTSRRHSSLQRTGGYSTPLAGLHVGTGQTDLHVPLTLPSKPGTPNM